MVVAREVAEILRESLSTKFDEWASQHEDTLERIYEGMSQAMDQKVRDDLRDAARKGSLTKYRQIIGQAGIPKKYEDLWSAIDRDARDELGDKYKEVWETDAGRQMREFLRKTIRKTNYNKLLSLAAVGAWDVIEKMLGRKIPDDLKKFVKFEKWLATELNVKGAIKNAWE
jgi:hypothetical protein